MDNISCIKSIEESVTDFLEQSFGYKEIELVRELVDMIQIDVDNLYEDASDNAYDKGYDDGFKCGKDVSCRDEYFEGYHDGMEDEKIRMERIEELEEDLQELINIKNE